MDTIKEIIQPIIAIVIFVAFWFIFRKIFKSISDKINNSEVYKEDTLRVLEEIRDELKQLNQKDPSK